MSQAELEGWDRLRHGGLLLDAPRVRELAAYAPAEPLDDYTERELRRQAGAVLDGTADIPAFVSFVLRRVCGFSESTGLWRRGSDVPASWGRPAVTGEVVKPRQLWEGSRGGVLPVFIDRERRIGIGRGRKAVSHVLQWLRAGDEQLALLTNGRQWRLIFAGLDFDAFCEWDLGLWLEEGGLSPQVTALRTLLGRRLWTPPEEGEPPPLLRAVLDSRKGQAELSQVLGERVREAVEILVHAHGEELRERCPDVPPAEIYRAAVRVVMRLVVILFAESRELLPADNALYHDAYGLTGLLEELERTGARGGGRLARSWSAWPRVLALFRLVHQGSHHPELPVPAYGGELFAPGDASTEDGLTRALAVFENACFGRELLSDREAHRILDRLTRTRIKVRQGRSRTWVPAPVDFSGLSTEYIGILYEGLLDFELKTAPPGDPVVFLAVGSQPALPLSRLEGMDDPALRSLLEKMKDTSSAEEGEAEEAADASAEDEEELSAKEADDGTEEDEEEPETAEEDVEDERHATRTRAETWARRAAEVGKLVHKPKGKKTPERQRAYEEALGRKARQLVTRVVLPGEWYLVRWGGTRKGSGTFYTRPGLAVPTVQRTLRPLAWHPPEGSEERPEAGARRSGWTARRPEEILDLRVVDPACGSGSFLVGALRFLTDALYASLYHHGRIRDEGDRSVVALLGEAPAGEGAAEPLSQELVPCRPDDDEFEPRLKAVLRRHVVERCLYGVDVDPLATELCRLSLWIETLDRRLPFSFLDHKVKCGNSLVGAWFDQFQHYPAMAWKNRDGGDQGHTNGVRYAKEERTKALKRFVKETLTPDIRRLLGGKTLFDTSDPQEDACAAHDEALALLSRLHALPVTDAAERARLYREELLRSEAWRALKEAMDLWCACWFWPAEALDRAPLPTTLSDPPAETRELAARLAAEKRFFHWELEFPDVFREPGSGFDAVLGNPPWDIAKPNSKEFFSTIDPLYRSYGKQEALSKQTEYFEHEATERGWLDYNAHFRSLSHFTRYAASPFGDPDESDSSQDRFAIARGHENKRLHARWHDLRAKARGFADPAHPFRHQGSADVNLYKLFLEQAHALLGEGGRLGFVTPSGLYSDHGTGALRELFLERCRWEWLFGFENHEGIFDIHRSFKFNPIVVEKGGETDAIQTAFMRRRLEDWEHAERVVTPYAREQVERFSPRSNAILEIQSARDLEILDKIYSNSVLLGDESPNGWGIQYAREFDMTNDSKLFPPRPRWEAAGYRPDEYSRWVKGDWRPIEELWAELGVDTSPEEYEEPQASLYQKLPIARAEIPEGIILSEDGDQWITEQSCVALPVYGAKAFELFDFSAKGWVRGKGRSAVWEHVGHPKRIQPEYLMDQEVFFSEVANQRSWVAKLLFKDISTAVHHRTMISCIAPWLPSINAAPSLSTEYSRDILSLQAQLGSFVVDLVSRLRIGYLHLNYFVIEELPLVAPTFLSETVRACVERAVLSLSAVSPVFSPLWLRCNHGNKSWRELWAVSERKRMKLRCACDASMMALFGLSWDDAKFMLRDCDAPRGQLSPTSERLSPKGFWRVDRERDPELRHTVLTLCAFRDLRDRIQAVGGDVERAVAEFLDPVEGKGWSLPDELRLTDFGLGRDERAKCAQPVAAQLGPQFYKWQLGQDTEESWRECRLHARNLLGADAYKQLVESPQSSSVEQRSVVGGADRQVSRSGDPQATLFGRG